jgi:hypothetical protein
MSSKYDKDTEYDVSDDDDHIEKKEPKPKKVERDLRIYPIKIDDSKLNEGESKYPLSSPVHLHIVVGRVKAGKSLLINNLYLSERFFKDDYEVRILISSTAYNDAINKYMIEEFDFIFTEYTEELLDEIVQLVKRDEGKGRFLIVLDDIIGNVKFSRGKTDAISSLITKFRHIGNEDTEGKLAICITTQYFKYISTIARNNATAYYVMGTFPEAEMKKISESLSFFGGGDKEFIEIFRRSRIEDFDFTYLSVEHLEARRNHENLIWSKKEGFTEPFNPSGKAVSFTDVLPNDQPKQKKNKKEGDIDTIE